MSLHVFFYPACYYVVSEEDVIVFYREHEEQEKVLDPRYMIILGDEREHYKYIFYEAYTLTAHFITVMAIR